MSLFHGSKISGSQLVSVSKDDSERQRDRKTMIGLYKQNNNFAHALGLFNISKPSLHDCDMKLRNLISGARPLYEYVKTTQFSFSFDKLNEIEQDRFLKQCKCTF